MPFCLPATCHHASLITANAQNKPHRQTQERFSGVRWKASPSNIGGCWKNWRPSADGQLTLFTSLAAEHRIKHFVSLPQMRPEGRSSQGPIEATALGNIAVQAIASGLIGSIAEARAVIRRSFNVSTYEPQHSAGWAAAYERFLKITGLPS